MRVLNMKSSGSLKCQNTKRFPKEVVGIFIETANFVLDNLEFVPWGIEKMQRMFGKRSLKNLLREPQTNYLFPCLDAAILAVHYLTLSGVPSYLKLLTEKQVAKKFHDKRARLMHLDSLVEIAHKDTPYSLDIGSGDITFLTPLNPGISGEEIEYFTTRHDEWGSIWTRSPFLRIDGRLIEKYPELPPLEFLESEHNLINVPYCLNASDFQKEQRVKSKLSLFDINKRDYDKEALIAYNDSWTKANIDFLPCLKTFQYI
jgi:hypothetical protein